MPHDSPVKESRGGCACRCAAPWRSAPSRGSCKPSASFASIRLSSFLAGGSFGANPASATASLQRAQWTPRHTLSRMPVCCSKSRAPSGCLPFSFASLCISLRIFLRISEIIHASIMSQQGRALVRTKTGPAGRDVVDFSSCEGFPRCSRPMEKSFRRWATSFQPFDLRSRLHGVRRSPTVPVGLRCIQCSWLIGLQASAGSVIRCNSGNGPGCNGID